MQIGYFVREHRILSKEATLALTYGDLWGASSGTRREEPGAAASYVKYLYRYKNILEATMIAKVNPSRAILE